MTAIDNSSSHSLFTKCPRFIDLNHPRIGGFPTLAFHFCPVSTRIRLSWAQDLNFKLSDHVIVTKSPPAVEWHGAVLIMQTAPCHSTAGGDFVTMARSLSLKFKSCAQDNRMRVETGQKWKARVGKPPILGWLR